MNHKFWEVEMIGRSYGFTNTGESVVNLYRVLKTRDALKGVIADSDTLYKTMQTTTANLGRHFPGDAELFYRIYQALSGIEAYEIIDYLAIIAQGSEMVIPDVLTHKFDEHITSSVKSVLFTECEKYGKALLDMIANHKNIKFVLTCKQPLVAGILSYVYGAHCNVSLVSVDIYTYGFITEKYDLIISVPMFGGRLLVDGEDFISREPGMIAVQNLLYHLKMDGELVIVLPAKITFASGSAETLRQFITDNYKIKEINVLPAGLFAPYTSINTYLFSFSTGKTDDVILRKYTADKPVRRTSACTELILQDEKLLFSDEFIALNGWNVDMAFSEEDKDIQAYVESPVKKILLKNTASVFRGKAITSKSESGNIGVINISNITDTGIDYSGLDLIEDEERKIARYALEDGDVLVTSRGTTVKVAVFDKQPITCIPSANINVIRPEGNLRGAYLKLFLESPVGSKRLKSLQRGTGIVNINYKDLNELEVPILPTQAQDAIVSEYNVGLQLYKQSLAAAEEAWRGVQAEIQSKMY